MKKPKEKKSPGQCLVPGCKVKARTCGNCHNHNEQFRQRNKRWQDTNGKKGKPYAYYVRIGWRLTPRERCLLARAEAELESIESRPRTAKGR